MYGIAGIAAACVIVAAHNGFLGLLFSPVAIFIGLVTAYPIFDFLVGLGKTRWWHAVLAGSLFALTAGTIGLVSGRPANLWLLVALVPWGASGALLGMVVWMIAIYLNPAYEYESGSARFPLKAVNLVILIPVVYGYLYATSSEFLDGCISEVSSGSATTRFCNRYVTGTTETGDRFSGCWSFDKFLDAEIGGWVRLEKYRSPDLRTVEYKVVGFHASNSCPEIDIDAS